MSFFDTVAAVLRVFCILSIQHLFVNELDRNEQVALGDFFSRKDTIFITMFGARNHNLTQTQSLHDEHQSL